MRWRMGLDLARLALLNVRRRPLRSGLTALGVAIGVTTVVGLLGLSGGVQRAIERQLARLGPDLVLLLPATPPAPGAAPSTSGATFSLDLKKLGALPGAAEVGALLRRTLPVRTSSVQGFFTVIGVAPRVEEFTRFVSRFELALGRFPQTRDEILLTQAAARDLRLDLGDTLEIAGEAFTVGGILRPTGDSNVEGAIFLSLETLWTLVDAGAQEISLAWARAGGPEPQRVEALAREVEAQLAAQGLAGRMLVQTAPRVLEVVEGVLGALRGAFTALAAIALLVGAVGLTNTMYTAVLERRREIGVLLALGARPSQIAALYLLEAGLLGLLGGALGLIAGVGLAQSFALLLRSILQAPAISVGLDLTLLGVALGGAIGLGLVAGGLPAYRAAGLSPAWALRFE